MGKSKGKAGHKALSISQELAENDLIPSVLLENFAGLKTISVTFGMHNLDPGGEIPIQHMDEPPIVAILEARDEALYTCVFVDADAEAGPEYLHYMVTNIPGKQANSRVGDVVLPYSAPSKQQGQGTHRYLVVVLEQGAGGKRLTVAPPKHRAHFKIQDFAKVHGLAIVGASFFLGDWDAAPPAQRKLTSASSLQRVEKQTPTYAKASGKRAGAEAARGPEIAKQRLAYDMEMIAKSGLLSELVLEGVFRPRFPLHVAFEGEDEITAGDEATPMQMERAPSVGFESGDEQYYTLLVLDADFPSLQVPTDRCVLLAMVINIPGEEGDAAVGDAIIPYMPPSDLPGGTGTHRYLALLLEQEGIADPDMAPEERRHFDLLSFMKAHAPPAAEHGVMPLAAASLWLGTYKH